MKHLILLTILSLTMQTKAQLDVEIPQNIKLKKGIYFSFDEIKNNAPGYSDSIIVRERTKGSLTMWGGGKHTFDLPEHDQKSFKKFRKTYIGVSDGELFYIGDRVSIGGWQGMNLSYGLGPYFIVESRVSAAQYTGGGLIGAMIKLGDGFLVNLEKGTKTILNKKALKKIMKDYPEIEEEYADRDDLMEFAWEIIGKINLLGR